MGRSLLLFAGFTLFFALAFAGYGRGLADFVHKVADLDSPMLPYLRLAFPLLSGAIASAAFLRCSRLSRRLPSRYPGQLWIACGVAWDLLVAPALIALLLLMDRTLIGGFAVWEWAGFPGAIALVVGCTKALLAASPAPAG